MEKEKKRFSNFSSSAIYKLASKGRGALTIDNVGSSFYTYIKEKKREKKLNRSISNTVYTRAIIWGIVCELYIFAKKLDTSFSDMNNVGRLTHPDFENWTGVPDTFRRIELVVGDIKSPSSLIKFCDLIENTEEGLESFKINHPDYYWQLVSNAILTGVDKAELLFYIPYLSEMKDILYFVEHIEQESLPLDLDLAQIQWIANEINAFVTFGKNPIQIPYLPNDCEYKDFNTFLFDVPNTDKEFLTERVKMAIEKLKN
ncbi:hypothetical protein AVT43_gp61 [Polaribacter phage P12002L]|uniref:Uncharacterized protein n=2 Tax=Incheonvirus TaxID=2976977 RepID=A0A0F7IK18_9CAUD|nr:hypothetical protein AVT42_gp63 [Polaribacter phage P12002S]YP_009209721.1 hypothetical protein AVT43_gp61 [Polaribacter phage P12002L]AKG94235.1 hypothetical protein P12002L_0061 [Polaribacter phage P12002L]AKG94319.1 hypothetical protein P12002S_0063 [Polaribacter phage P12002S]